MKCPSMSDKDIALLYQVFRFLNYFIHSHKMKDKTTQKIANISSYRPSMIKLRETSTKNALFCHGSTSLVVV